MKNQKVIVVCGLSRGGTSILWNLLQSHPSVCGPVLETGELIYRKMFHWLPQPIRPLVRRLLSNPSFCQSTLGRWTERRIDRLFYQWKLKNVGHEATGTKYDGVPYTREDVEPSVLCLKSVDWDIFLNDCFRQMYRNIHFIGLIRNGYSVCNGRVRRGKSPEAVGKQYARVAQEMIRCSDAWDRFKIVRFEDVIADPFAISRELFSFCGLSPVALPKLRLKSKCVLSSNGAHQPRFGETDRTYWFDRRQIVAALDPRIDERQASSLTPEDRIAFERHAHHMLDHFGYQRADRLRRAAA